MKTFKPFWGSGKKRSQAPESRRTKTVSWPFCYYVSSAVIDATHDHLRGEGRKPREGLVYWAGWFDDSNCIVSSIILPHGVSRWGGVEVPTEEMIRISALLRELDLLLVAQVHTHPGDHGHSPGDDVSAVSSMPGFLSIVVPDFDQFNMLPMKRCYFHRYVGNGKWKELAEADARDIIHIDPLRIT